MSTSGQPGPSSSNSNGGPPARLLSDPNAAICPDFSSEAFKDVRALIDPDNGIAITKLTKSWTDNNDQLKQHWAAQVETDRQIQAAEEAQRQLEADQDAPEAARVAEEEKLEAEKKKPKLGDFDVNSAPPAFIESPISLFAQRKLERREYCPLWPFTPGGLREAADARLSSNDDISSLKLSRNDENQLTVQSGPASSTHKNMARDEHLTWRQFSLGSNRYIKEIVRAGWPRVHVETLTQFFYSLEQHDLHNIEGDGENILKIYADRIRSEWFRTLGSSQSFNIAIIEDKIMSKISDEYFTKKRSSQPPVELSCR
ncbi:hypothetical protein R3P38DRAFT_3212711 [Favolaschia claudopus]|uniref:Uncharacterized protein n=1 Tax=Favolaschia claudopus TaxID=2862362 RepID=A0AAW0ACX0_9AGAR